MIIKIDIELVTGFIGSGKTRFVNSLVENTIVQGEKIIIIQCESGETELSSGIKENSLIKVIKLDLGIGLDLKKLEYVASLYTPHRVIIEFNGTQKIEDFITEFQNSRLVKKLKISTVYHVTDGVTFKSYINNMGAFIIGSIYSSDLIIVNNIQCITKENLEWIMEKLKELNSEAYILSLSQIGDLNYMLKKEELLSGGFFKKCNVFFKNLIMNN